MELAIDYVIATGVKLSKRACNVGNMRDQSNLFGASVRALSATLEQLIKYNRPGSLRGEDKQGTYYRNTDSDIISRSHVCANKEKMKTEDLEKVMGG